MTKPWQKGPNAPKRLTGRRAVARRLRWFEAHPLCVVCEKQGRVSAATILDHIVPLAKGGADDESNMQGLCDACNDIKTAADLGRKPRPRIGLDGWAVDE